MKGLTNRRRIVSINCLLYKGTGMKILASIVWKEVFVRKKGWTKWQAFCKIGDLRDLFLEYILFRNTAQQPEKKEFVWFYDERSVCEEKCYRYGIKICCLKLRKSTTASTASNKSNVTKTKNGEWGITRHLKWRDKQTTFLTVQDPLTSVSSQVKQLFLKQEKVFITFLSTFYVTFYLTSFLWS